MVNNSTFPFLTFHTEVERATALIRSVACGKVIVRVETSEDTIVYTGTDHTEFVRAHNLL